jgi:hypothetical protein
VRNAPELLVRIRRVARFPAEEYETVTRLRAAKPLPATAVGAAWTIQTAGRGPPAAAVTATSETRPASRRAFTSSQ